MGKISKKDLIRMIKNENSNIDVPNLKQNIHQNIEKSYILNQPVKTNNNEKPRLKLKITTAALSFCILLIAIGLFIINIKPYQPGGDNLISKPKQAYVMQATSLFNFATDSIYKNEFTPLNYSSINNDYDYIAEKIMNNLYTVEEFFNKENNKYELFVLENEEYQFKLVTYMNLDEFSISYTMYYNEKPLHDIDDDREMDEVSSKITGYIECNNTKYNIEGIKEIEKDETEIQLKLFVSETNYIIVEQEIEKRENEYTYSFYENNQIVKEIEVSMEEKNNKEIIELSIENKKTNIEEEYEFIKKNKTIEVIYEENDKEIELVIYITQDVYEFDFGNGNKIKYNRNKSKGNKNFSKFTNKTNDLIVL